MPWLKKTYLYLVSLVALIITVIGLIMLLNMALKTWVFPKADQTYYSYPACPKTVSGPDAKLDDCTQEQLEQQKKFDEANRIAQKQRDAAQALAFIIVGAPVWWFHWRIARKES
jgi:hypothetical protein